MLFKKNKIEALIDELIERTLVQMSGERVSKEDYANGLEMVERLAKLKSLMADKKVSKDTILLVIANLVGICLILGYEHVNVISSKALGFVMKGRV